MVRDDDHLRLDEPAENLGDKALHEGILFLVPPARGCA